MICVSIFKAYTCMILTATDMFKICLFFIQASQKWKRTNSYIATKHFPASLYIKKQHSVTVLALLIRQLRVYRTIDNRVGNYIHASIATVARIISLLANIQYIAVHLLHNIASYILHAHSYTCGFLFSILANECSDVFARGNS